MLAVTDRWLTFLIILSHESWCPYCVNVVLQLVINVMFLVIYMWTHISWYTLITIFLPLGYLRNFASRWFTEYLQMLSGRNIKKKKKKRLCTSHTLLLPLNHSINEREFIQKQQKNMHNVKETEERVGNGDRPWGRMVCTIVDNQSKMVLGLLYIFLNKLWPSVIETLIGKG